MQRKPRFARARQAILQSLSPEAYEEVEEAVLADLEALSGQGNRGVSELMKNWTKYREQGLDAVLGELIPVQRVYLFWENPGAV